MSPLLSATRLARMAFCFGLAAVAAPQLLGQVLTTDVLADADTYIRDATDRGSMSFMDVRGGSVDFRGYVRFDLSALNIDEISNATLTFSQIGGASRNDGINTGRVAIYGLTDLAGNTPQDWVETGTGFLSTANKGTEDVTTLTGVVDLDDGVAGITELVTGSSPNGLITLSGSALVSFLQERVMAGGLATFIISNDDATDRGYGIATKENGTESLISKLSLEYTTAVVPEPAAAGLLGGAAALLVALRRRRA